MLRVSVLVVDRPWLRFCSHISDGVSLAPGLERTVGGHAGNVWKSIEVRHCLSQHLPHITKVVRAESSFANGVEELDFGLFLPA